jgi:hypothetical protein
MKKLILLTVGGLLLGNAFAAPLSGQEDFSAWKNFSGVFEKIYNDTRVLDVTAVCERVLEWPYFWDTEGKLIFSLEDCEEFAETGRLSSFVNTHSGSKVDIDRWIEIFRQKYSFEERLWRYEYNLQRTITFSSIWQDGDGGGGLSPEKINSPVDLVVVWNEIDEILFGTLAEYPEFASFTESDADIFVPWQVTPEEDDWIDQRAEKKMAYGIEKKHYPDGEASIAGGFAEQSRIFEEELNVHSLIPGRATTQTFDMPFTGIPVPMGTGMYVDTAASPAESPDVPEQMMILEQTPMGELEGAFAKFFRQQSATELRDAQEDGSRMNWLQRIFVTAPIQTDQEFSDTISQLLRLRAETRAQDIGTVEVVPLQQFNTTLDVWIDTLEKWKTANESFLTHTAQ